VLIKIDKLKRRPRQIVIDVQATDSPALQDLIEQGTVTFKKSINGALEVTRAGQAIKVAGHLTTTITSPCGRCLLPVVSQLEVPVMLCYADRDNIEETPFAEEVEIQREEISLIPFSGAEIDLQPDLAQEIIMALPQQPLCQEVCLGLCPVCGYNLNQGSCDCEPPIFHAGLATLKKFKVKH
jgi:uncharacterized protein